jgi:site-specific DNA-methyltransferase (adenine-specific)
MEEPNQPYRLILGDALAELRHLPSDSVDAVIVDGPYSSGGLTRSDRNQSPNDKYTQQGTKNLRPEFSGDNRDSRSYAYWCQLWLSECLRIVKPSGYRLTFTDWRQLPTTTDALQAAGWVWRGLIVWDKTEGARGPHTGYFRHQAEFIPWGTKGVSRPSQHGGPWPGVYRMPVKQSDKHHVTGKPTDLLRKLVQVVPPGGVILDPMQGSGTCGVASILEGRRYIGIELDPTYHGIAAQRIGEARQAA